MEPEKKGIVMAALGAGASIGIILPFSRANETEADEIGLILMSRAGYDPKEAISFWDRFSNIGGKSPPAFLSTHPPSPQRRDDLQRLLPKALAEYESSAKLGSGKEF